MSLDARKKERGAGHWVLVTSPFLLFPRYVVLFLIWLYQKTLSPDHSFWAKWVYPDGYCKFYPSCSSYGFEIIKKQGLIKGLPKAGWRVLRCNPWNDGGVDLPE